MPSNPEMDRVQFSVQVNREADMWGYAAFHNGTRICSAHCLEWKEGQAEDYANAVRMALESAHYAVISPLLRQARAQWEQERGTLLTDDSMREAWDADAAVTEGHVVAWDHLMPRSHLSRFAERIRARGQSPAPDVRALQREAAKRALIAFRDHRWADENASNCVEWRCLETFSDRYLAREYPDPAPPSVTPEPPKCERCKGPMGEHRRAYAAHDDVETCVMFLASQVAALAASHGGRDK